MSENSLRSVLAQFNAKYWTPLLKREVSPDEFNDTDLAHDEAVCHAALAATQEPQPRVAAAAPRPELAPAPDDDSPGDIIAAYPDGTIVLDDGITTHNVRRAKDYLAGLAAEKR